jgi:hypothetical protein
MRLLRLFAANPFLSLSTGFVLFVLFVFFVAKRFLNSQRREQLG